MKKIVIISLIFSFFLTFSFSKIQAVNQPKTFEETGKKGEEVIQITKKGLANTLKEIWEKEVLPIWGKMWNWFDKNIWADIENWFREIFQERRPTIREEFEKEKQEMKEDLSRMIKNIMKK